MSRRFALAPLLLVCLVSHNFSPAQTPVALPYTMTTLAGLSAMSGTAGTQCPNLATGVKSTDAYGDGCLAANGIFGALGRGGVAADAFGNIFVADDIDSVIHMINQSSGIMTKVAGGGTACSGKLDAAGDGCVAATGTVTNSPRGIGIDAYGNLLLAGYGDNLIHVVCRTASPLCSAPQIGLMELVAGCSNATGSSGTGGAGADNVKAYTTNAGTCTPALGEVDSPRGATGDMYGNVYFADTSSSRTRVVVGPLTSSYFSGNNPLYAALGVYYASVTQGFAYSVVNTTGTGTSTGGTATTKGSACSVTTNTVQYSGTAFDTLGDGCPFEFSSVKASSGYTSGVAVDGAGNLLFTDPTNGLRVFYVSGAGTAGAAMKAAIMANDGNVAPQAGFIYLLAGGGATSLSPTPTLGASTTVSDSTITKLAVSPQGHVYIGDSSKVLFFDMNSGYIRLLFTSSSNVTAGSYCSGSSGQQSLSAYSDGCPASKSIFSNSNGLGVAVDGQGNLYLYDASSNTTGMLVRKVLAQGLAEQTLGTSLAQTLDIHLPESASGTVSGSSAKLTSTTDMTAAAPTCTQNGDHSVDCTVAVTVTPSAAGLRSAALTVALPTGTWENGSATVSLGGTVTGSVLAADSTSTTLSGVTTPLAPTTSSVFSSITPVGVALDGAGNVYAMDANSGDILESVQGAAGAALSTGLPSSPGQLAVDQLGDVFAVGSGTPNIIELTVSGAPAAAGAPATFTAATIAYTTVNAGTPAPQAIALDRAGNLFVADQQSSAANTGVYRLSLVSNTMQPQVTVATGFTKPVSLAVDTSGNVYVADKGAGAVYKLSPAAAGSYTQTTLLSSIVPVAVAVDPAGDVYIQDESSASVLMVPVSGPGTVSVLTGLSSPTGLAVDGKGDVFSADANNTSLTEVVRDGLSYNFGANESIAFNGTLTDAGSQPITGSNTVTNTTNFDVVGGSSNGCSFTSSVLSALTAGEACTLSATLVGNGSSTVSDVLSFLPSASTVGSLTLSGTLQGVAIGTTTSIAGPSPALPVYSQSGTEATFTVTVAPTSGATAPGGTVAVTVDSTTTNPTLVANGSNGVATVTISGLTAGAHTISAVYSTSGSFTGSSAAQQNFAIGQISTSVSWTPSATSQEVSQAIGAANLNASASPIIPGNFVYTATPSGGTSIGIDASTYLPLGTYSLAVTFYPNDATDYTTSTASVASYSVTKATGTPAVGATTSLVASDGTGNYTSLTAALAALPVTGGTLYIKPGTYTGQNAISYPNVSLRGLGGDPTKVILTAEDGAFSSPFTGYLGTGTGSGNANASGDQGSSTLDVTKSYYMGQTSGSSASPIGVTNTTQYTPNNFYAEYLTIQNTYNTDAAATTNYSTTSGSCAAGSSAQTLQYWYNSGLQCNSQALALWIESDQAVLNNVNLTSQQDTLYAGSQGCGTYCTVARQYMWHGTITGDVDYVFGDAALVFDHTNFFTTWHGTTATGTETIEAQNKKFETGSANDYLSGYICNDCTLLSQSTGMSNLYYGRPYGAYSTWIMLNSYVDQVNPAGWIEFSGDTNLPTSTYAEFNTQPYTDPAVGTYPYPGTLFGGTVTPTGGNSGAGVTGTREVTSQDPGTLESANAIKTQLSAAEAAQYLPVSFLSTTVSSATLSSGQTATWNPVTALASQVNAFASTGNITLNSNTQSVTILGRPQTPGAGILPTGPYAFYDSVSGATCSAVSASCVQLASGSLDASGEAYLTTSSLAAGKTHTITMVYNGDLNFTGGTSPVVTITVPAAPLVATTTALTVTNTSSIYGGSIAGSVTVTPQTGTGTPTGSITFYSGANAVGACTLSGGSCTYSLSGVGAGVQSLTAGYSGDMSFSASTSSGATISVARAILQVAANSYTISVGASLPAFAATISGFVNGDTQATATTGSPTITSSAANSNAPGVYPISVTIGTLSAANYNFAYSVGYLHIVSATQAPAVATGDTRTVTEPEFPAVCQQLTAAITTVNNDIPTTVDATVTNPDGARIQAALNACSGTRQAVELSVSGAGNNAFLSGPLSMPSNVTLLVDPGVVLFFSRNVQDYDTVPGMHTCGTVNNNSATSSCKPLVDIPGSSTNVGIMGFGKLDGRGGDTLLNAIAPYQGFTWWGLSNAANGVGNQQNPRFVQLDGGSSNITLYKITVRNSPLFHISTTGGVTNFTAWDVKVITPTSSRNTDGIDPGNAQNFTITRSWVSDGDDNVAVGAAGSTPSENISVTNNHFFAGHGESIGSYTSAGASNILFDGNISAGNGFAGHGSAVSATGAFSGGVNDGNSTGIRIKSANDRGGLVTNIQYSNGCLLDHSVDVQFTPLYNTNTGSETPNFENILMQNLVFVNDDSSAGSEQYTGADNATPVPPVINPLQVTLDNVTFPSALSASSFTTTGTAGTETNAQLTYGPGQVSSNFIAAWSTFAGSNGDTATNNISATSLAPPACSFTYIAPELTGPSGLPQTISYGQNAAAIVILTPAVGGAAYPTGTVTLTDALTGNQSTVSLSGTSDTISIPLTNLSVGTHTFTATYSGDSNYVVPGGSSYYTSAGPYTVIVNSASLPSTTTTLSGVPSSTTFGTAFTATAAVIGNNPTGTVEFLVNGAVYATASLISGSASTPLGLPYSATAYSITAIYSGDNANAGSTSATASVTVGPALTTTGLAASATTTTLGHPVLLTATVSSAAGTPTGTVTFSYTTATNSTAVSLPSVSLSNGAASASADLPVGTDYVTASFAGGGSYAASSSTAMSITVNLPTILPLPANPIALPYTVSTIAGGSGLAVPSTGNMACAGAVDKYGDGCLATAIGLSSGDDLRAVVADPFGNVYFTDISASLVRKIAPNGIISNFAGRVSGTACVPSATAGCTPTLVSLSKPRGVNSDLAGNIYISDYSQNKVYKVLVSTGLMYLVAGTGTAGSTGDGGLAASAEVDAPRGAWGDTVGNIYIADTSASKIRLVDSTGIIHTFAGTGTAGFSGDGGPATSAEINTPASVLVDANLNVYIDDFNNGRIRVVCVTCGTISPLDALLARLGISSPVNGDIYTIAGGAASSYSGSYPTLGTNVTMSPQKLAMDQSGDLYVSDGNGVIWFLDARTAQIRPIAKNSTSVCAGATDSIGDGCPATQSEFADGGNGIGVGNDLLGNMYFTDTADLRIRKVSTNLTSASTTVGSTLAAPVELHFIAGDGLASTNGLVQNSTEWSLSTPTCTFNSDTTTDCILKSSFTPAVPGVRSTPLAVNSTDGNTGYLALAGYGLGAGATLDPATQINFGKSLQVAGLGIDNQGNIYVSDSTSKTLLRYAPSAISQGSSATGTTLAALVAPGAVAVDPRGFAYVADTSSGTVTQVSPAGAIAVLPFTFAAPAGLAVDGFNNLYVSDSSAKAVYQISPFTNAEQTLAVGTLVSPAGLSIDPSGNLLITDPGAPAIYRFNLASNARSTVATSASAPDAVVTDAAGNLLIADTASILAVPASSQSAGFPVASLTPSALAIDSAGNLYTGAAGGVLELERTQGSVQFSSATAAPQTVELLEAGNQVYQATAITQTDSQDYSLAPTATSDCALSSTGMGTLAVGGVCSLTASYAPTSHAATSDTVTFNGNLANAALSVPSAVNLTLSGPGLPNPPIGNLEQVRDNLTGSTTVSTADSLLVAGWVYDPQTGTSLKSVTIYVDGLAQGTVTPGIPRPDVVSYYGNPAYLYTGYEASYSVAGLSAGAHTATAIAVDAAGLSTTFGPLAFMVTTAAPPTSPLFGNIEQVLDATTAKTPISQLDSVYIAGWVANPNSGATLKPLAVQVDGAAVGNVALTSGIPRTDVAAIYGSSYLDSGFVGYFPAAALSAGTHKVTVLASDSLGNSVTFGPISFTVTAAPPFGILEQARDNLTGSTTVSTSDSLLVAGWAVDPSTGTSLKSVTVYIDGAAQGTPTLGIPRPDVVSALGNPAYLNCGYEASYPVAGLGSGAHKVTVVAVDAGGLSTTFGPLAFTVTTTPPASLPLLGSLEQVLDATTAETPISQLDSVYIAGWVADPNSGATLNSLSVKVDGVALSNITLTTGIARTDVAEIYGNAYLNSGFTGYFPASSLAAGTHSVTVVATDSLNNTITLAPLSFTVAAAPPFGNLEQVSDSVTGTLSSVSQSNSLVIVGWVADKKDGAPLSNVTVYIDGTSTGPPSLGIARPDVAASYNNPAYLSSGYDLINLASGLSIGGHNVTVVAVDSQGASTTFGPLSFTVTAPTQ